MLLKEEKDGTFTVMPGADIKDAVIEAIRLSAERKCIITFEHNGVTVNISYNSNPDLIYRKWLRVFKAGPVGP